MCAQVMTAIMQLLYCVGKRFVPVKPSRKKERSFYIFIFKGFIDLFTSIRKFIPGKNKGDPAFRGVATGDATPVYCEALFEGAGFFTVAASFAASR